jgi:hypothetical protein
VSEILRRNAGDDVEKRMLAGLILVSRDWCWSTFQKIDHPQRRWAIDTLARYLRDDDCGVGPALLTLLKTKEHDK